MTTKDVALLFEFNAWANSRTRQAVDTVLEEKLYVDMKDSFGGIHGTLVHLVGAEDVWRQRLNGIDPGIFMKKELYPTYASVITQWRSTEAGLTTYVASLTDEILARDLVFHNLKGELVTQKIWMSLQHLVNHSSYHRGQITTLVRQAGGTPVGTDLIAFYRKINQ